MFAETQSPRPDVCREYNELVASCKEEVAEMKQMQQTSMAEQMKLDEESLQRIRAAEDAKKVSRVDADSPWCRGSAETRGQGSV